MICCDLGSCLVSVFTPKPSTLTLLSSLPFLCKTHCVLQLSVCSRFVRTLRLTFGNRERCMILGDHLEIPGAFYFFAKYCFETVNAAHLAWFLNPSMLYARPSVHNRNAPYDDDRERYAKGASEEQTEDSGHLLSADNHRVYQIRPRADVTQVCGFCLFSVSAVK